jgi:hypothetical protein
MMSVTTESTSMFTLAAASLPRTGVAPDCLLLLPIGCRA